MAFTGDLGVCDHFRMKTVQCSTQASPSDNDYLNLLYSDWFENLSNCLPLNLGKDFIFANKIGQMVQNKSFVWSLTIRFD